MILFDEAPCKCVEVLMLFSYSHRSLFKNIYQRFGTFVRANKGKQTPYLLKAVFVYAECAREPESRTLLLNVSASPCRMNTLRYNTARVHNLTHSFTRGKKTKCFLFVTQNGIWKDAAPVHRSLSPVKQEHGINFAKYICVRNKTRIWPFTNFSIKYSINKLYWYNSQVNVLFPIKKLTLFSKSLQCIYCISKNELHLKDNRCTAELKT